MCSVVGYIGKNLSSAFIFEGLARLEYRGYDAAGFACLDQTNARILCVKSSGQLSQLVHKVKKNPIDGFVGIGHTRWSTHGDHAEKNAHPHFDCSGTVSVVHNGIIENHYEIKKDLEAQGHIFVSSTDTEVVAHLVETLMRDGADLAEVMPLLVHRLKGMYSLVIMLAAEDLLIAVRKRSPLCIGYGNDEMFVASDMLAFGSNVSSLYFLPDETYAFITKKECQIYDFFGNPMAVAKEPFIASDSFTDKAGYEHFMLKEIDEQPVAIKRTVAKLAQLGTLLWQQLAIDPHSVERIVLAGCGTSWHAACIARFFFEKIGLPVQVLLASEARYSTFFPDKKSLYIVISQSGETADTLELLRLINSENLMTVGLTNVATSTIVREAEGFLLTDAGTEVAVASTKAFSTQLTALYWLAQAFANAQSLSCAQPMIDVEQDLVAVGQTLFYLLQEYRLIIEQTIAPYYASYEKAIFLGKHSSYPFAMEAALKLKEIAYVFAQSYPAGELKHGSIALIDDTVLVYIFSHKDPLIYAKILSSAYAVHSRGGKIIVFAYADQQELSHLAHYSFIIPDTDPLLGSLAMTGLMQFLMYSIAKVRGCPIDKPRNLAKSVTVE